MAELFLWLTPVTQACERAWDIPKFRKPSTLNGNFPNPLKGLITIAQNAAGISQFYRDKAQFWKEEWLQFSICPSVF